MRLFLHEKPNNKLVQLSSRLVGTWAATMSLQSRELLGRSTWLVISAAETTSNDRSPQTILQDAFATSDKLTHPTSLPLPTMAHRSCSNKLIDYLLHIKQSNSPLPIIAHSVLSTRKQA